jgi:hypothetical protein
MGERLTPRPRSSITTAQITWAMAAATRPRPTATHPVVTSARRRRSPDGTLIDSVYQHVLAWREALAGEGIDIPVWSIHRKIGMSGGLFATCAVISTTSASANPTPSPADFEIAARRAL